MHLSYECIKHSDVFYSFVVPIDTYFSYINSDFSVVNWFCHRSTTIVY